jgi:hypothetical protein
VGWSSPALAETVWSQVRLVRNSQSNGVVAIWAIPSSGRVAVYGMRSRVAVCR